jgi:hypothetical protein
MSLNKFTDPQYTTPKPWMNIRCNQLSFGDSNGKLRTQAYAPSVTSDWGSIVSVPPLYYTCDHTSVRIKGHINFETSASPVQNYFNLEVKMPGELVSRFGTGSATECHGYVVEHPINNNINHALASSSAVNATNDGATIKFFFLNGNVSTQYTNRIYIDLCFFKS